MRFHLPIRPVAMAALTLGVVSWGMPWAAIGAGSRGALPAPVPEPEAVPVQIVAPTPEPPGRRVERSPIDGMPVLVSERGIEMPLMDVSADWTMPVMPLPPRWR